jgi:apolipoprotein N-acyltransferase
VLQKIHPLFVCLLLIVLGLINTFAYAPYQFTFLPLLTLPVLALAIWQAKSPRQAAWFGWSYGLGWFGLGVSWVHVSIATFGGMPLIFSLGIMAALVAYLALFPALAAWLTARFARNFAMAFPAAFSLAWVLAENLRSWVFTGFPWLSLGYTQTTGYLAAWAPLVGEIGITMLIAFFAAALLRIGQKQFIQPVFAVLLIAISPLLTAFKGWQLTGEQQNVVLVQGNIKQELRWDTEQEMPTMQKYMRLTRPYFGDSLIIWPEAAIPRLEHQSQGFLINLDMLAAENNSAVVTGILDIRYNVGDFNGMIVLGQTNTEPMTGSYDYFQTNRYRKHQLLPIGEFVPFEQFLRDVAPFFDLPNSSFTRGDWQQANLQAKGISLLPALCFEIAFPRQIQANFTADTDFLLTVSNDAWFGDSIGPWQHLQIAQMRALEFGRPLLRATNTGVSAIVNADGTIAEQLPQFSDAVLKRPVALAQGFTPYSQFGDWPVYVLSLLIIGWLVFLTWIKNRN